MLVALFATIVIWIVGKLGLGIELESIGTAFLTALVIAIGSPILQWLGNQAGMPNEGWTGAVIHLVVSALFLMLAGKMVKGLKVNGFGGAIVAAICIAIVSWAIGLAVKGMMPAS